MSGDDPEPAAAETPITPYAFATTEEQTKEAEQDLLDDEELSLLEDLQTFINSATNNCNF